MDSEKIYTEAELKEISEIEETIKSIFIKETIPIFLVRKANSLIAKWKRLTNWKEDTTPVLLLSLESFTPLDKEPNYQNNETRRH